MASKKKTSKKSRKSKPAARKKATPKNKKTQRRSVAKKVAPKKSMSAKKRLKKSAPAVATQRRRGRTSGSAAFSREKTSPYSGEQSGDLQDLSRVEDVDSESVDELMEEGNAFEAGVVSGVEESGRREGQEVRTREVPEDDVPEEYLDSDQ